MQKFQSLREYTVLTSSKEDLSFGVDLFAEDESLASSDNFASSAFALGALELEGDLLGVLCLLAEHGLGLTSETLLLGIVSPLTLGCERILSLLVLRHLMDAVLATLLAECVLRLGVVHLNNVEQSRVQN